MLLSTAIREGKIGVQQGFSKLVNRYGNEACALGCAGRRVGLWKTEEDTFQSTLGVSPYTLLDCKFPVLTKKFQHPEKPEMPPALLSSIIINLNDNCHWSIRKISQFVRQCEKESGL